MIKLTIKRPNGNTETMQRPEGGLSPRMFTMIQDAYRKAGQGEVLSWEPVDTRTAAEKAAHTLSDKIAKTEIALAKARDYDPQTACKLRDELETLKAQQKA